jgi:hypothetical protein
MCSAARRVALQTALVLTGCLFASGCIAGVSWTPDSRGFYFTSGKNYQKLFYFDVAAKRARPVAENQSGMVLWPAVSPDGQRVAVAVAVGAGGKKQFQVVVYDPQGKEVQRTRPILLERKPSGKEEKKDEGPLWVFWAPPEQGDKVLLQASNGCALIDLKEDRFTDLGNKLLLVLGDTPVRPDGKGFLALVPGPGDEEKKTELAFCDWQGNKQVISHCDEPSCSTLSFPFLVAARWQGAVATVRGRGLEVVVDTQKRTMIASKTKAVRTAENQVIRQSYRFRNTATLVRVVELEDRVNSPVRVEIVPQGAPARALTKKATLASLTPSPDGKILAARYSFWEFSRETEEHIAVIDARGEVLADIDLQKN